MWPSPYLWWFKGGSIEIVHIGEGLPVYFVFISEGLILSVYKGFWGRSLFCLYKWGSYAGYFVSIYGVVRCPPRIYWLLIYVKKTVVSCRGNPCFMSPFSWTTCRRRRGNTVKRFISLFGSKKIKVTVKPMYKKFFF